MPFSNQYMKQTKSNDMPPIDSVINIINKIIRTRAKPISNSVCEIDSLPSSLIGEITSCLHQQEHIRFSKSNRTIYIGCNSPNTMKTLNLETVDDYSV